MDATKTPPNWNQLAKQLADAPYATLRVPTKGRWMYVCASDLFDRTHYWRHRRVLPEDMFKNHDGAGRNCTYGRKFSNGIARNPAHKRRKEPDWFSEIPTYSLEDCKRALRKHHPDKGGDPKQAQIWTARLKKARQLEVRANDA